MAFSSFWAFEQAFSFETGVILTQFSRSKAFEHRVLLQILI